MIHHEYRWKRYIHQRMPAALPKGMDRTWHSDHIGPLTSPQRTKQWQSTTGKDNSWQSVRIYVPKKKKKKKNMRSNDKQWRWVHISEKQWLSAEIIAQSHWHTHLNRSISGTWPKHHPNHPKRSRKVSKNQQKPSKLRDKHPQKKHEAQEEAQQDWAPASSCPDHLGRCWRRPIPILLLFATWGFTHIAGWFFPSKSWNIPSFEMDDWG